MTTEQPQTGHREPSGNPPTVDDTSPPTESVRTAATTPPVAAESAGSTSAASSTPAAGDVGGVDPAVPADRAGRRGRFGRLRSRLTRHASPASPPPKTDRSAKMDETAILDTPVESPGGQTGKPAAAESHKLPSTRPPGVPQDPWTEFATRPERRPGWPRRALRAVGRASIHEYALVCYAALLLAVAMTWPALRYPLHTIPQDTGDPALHAWQLAWIGHILISDPSQLWQGNAFFPERFSLAFADGLLGYAPLGMIGKGAVAAVLRYNLVYVAAHALLVIGGYALVRQLGTGRTGAMVAAVAFAYAPWRLAQEGHLPIISAGGIPLALAMLARGHGWSLRYGFRPNRRRIGWVIAGWTVATWQFSLGLTLGLPFAYVIGAIAVFTAIAVAVRRLRRRGQGPVLGRRLLITDALGLTFFAGIGSLLVLPYVRVVQLYPEAQRTAAEIDFFSPPLRGMLIAPAESRIWGAAHATPRASLAWASEMTLLPGFALYALALGGLLLSVWTIRQRLFLLLGVLAAAVLSLGTGFFGGRWTYLPLFGHLPAFGGVRTPGLLVVWTTLLLGVLAGGAVAEFVRRIELMSAQRVPPWPNPWLRTVTLMPLLLVTIEGLGSTAHPLVPDQSSALRTVDGPALILPTSALGDQLVMLATTSKFQLVANGSAGFLPQRLAELRTTVATFPDQISVQYLRGLGITRVILLRNAVAGTPWERAGETPVDTLGIQREDLPDSVVFRLS